eukprot:scaffold196087_cov37-Prasinocladus_malaysianus.AAC.1
MPKRSRTLGDGAPAEPSASGTPCPPQDTSWTPLHTAERANGGLETLPAYFELNMKKNACKHRLQVARCKLTDYTTQQFVGV